MTFAIKEETLELPRMADAAQRKADAAWELVVITREDLKKPFWKKWFGY
jgi:hypothetical protein